MKLKSTLASFGVYPESCMAVSLATDGLKQDANILMVALQGFDERDMDMSMFISGGDVMATQRFTGIPKEVYDDQAVSAKDVGQFLQDKLDEFGVHNLICHQGFQFVQPRMLDAKLMRNSMSFVDIGLLHKALRFWTSNLDRATSMLDLQAKIKRMGGKNLISLKKLADHYEVDKDLSKSPYVPVNNAEIIRRIFEKQLEMELPV